MFPNIITVLCSAVIPLFIGFIYYNPKVLGKPWMEASGMTEEKMKGANMPVLLITMFVLSFFTSIILFTLVVHQTDIYSLLMNEKGFEEEGSAVMNTINDLMAKYGTNFRTFKRGALHGTILAIFFAFPILHINAMFERKSFKYTAIHTGYWIVCLALMGGILCQWG